MPIYEYKCGSCEHEAEYLQRISDDPKTECERCGGALERLISQTSFQLKGGGWYSDLYSSVKPDAAKDAAASGESKAATAKTESKGDKAGASSESKPAAKPAATAATGSPKSS